MPDKITLEDLKPSVWSIRVGKYFIEFESYPNYPGCSQIDWSIADTDDEYGGGGCGHAESLEEAVAQANAALAEWFAEDAKHV